MQILSIYEFQTFQFLFHHFSFSPSSHYSFLEFVMYYIHTLSIILMEYRVKFLGQALITVMELLVSTSNQF